MKIPLEEEEIEEDLIKDSFLSKEQISRGESKIISSKFVEGTIIQGSLALIDGIVPSRHNKKCHMLKQLCHLVINMTVIST